MSEALRTELRLVVAGDETGLRVDALLVRRGHFPSVAAARRHLESVTARIDGRRARKGDRLSAGTVVVVALPEAHEVGGVAPEPEAPLVVLASDDAFVVLDKPAGVPVHPLRSGERGTLAGALVARFPECRVASPDPREAGFAHRLDVATSGVIVAARTRPAYERLRALLGGGESEKIYLAELEGGPDDLRVPGPRDAGDPMVVDVPIGRIGRTGARVSLGEGRGLLPARTKFYLGVTRPSTMLVEARLSAGRAHQVRAHAALALGCPIVGDVLYGAKTNATSDGAGRGQKIHLHAWRLAIPHPTTGVPVTFEAPAPGWAR